LFSPSIGIHRRDAEGAESAEKIFKYNSPQRHKRRKDKIINVNNIIIPASAAMIMGFRFCPHLCFASFAPLRWKNFYLLCALCVSAVKEFLFSLR
jgi:hypothetical protein